MTIHDLCNGQRLAQPLRSRRVLILCAVLLLLAGGWGATRWHSQQVDAEIRQQLLAQVKAVARTVNPQRIKALSFTAADADQPAFQRLRGQMRNYARTMGHRGIYSIALRDGVMIFGPESFATDDPLASPPGTVYQKPPSGLSDVFQDGQPRVLGPYTDEYGDFVSAYAPILDPHSSRLLMITAIDIPAEQWRAQVRWAWWLLLLFMLGLIALLLTGSFRGFLNQRQVKLADLLAQARTAAMQENEERYRALFESLRDAVFVADATTGLILRVNQAAEKLLDRPRTEIVGVHQTALHPPGAAERYAEQFQRHVAGETAYVEAEVYTRDGRRVPVEITSSLIQMPDGSLALQGIFRDVTERLRALDEQKAVEEALHRLAHYDPLTHLPNRRLFLDHLTSAQAVARRGSHYGAILLVDLDDFKQVNDARGHAVGDQILCEVAARLTRTLREEDVVAHFGGDEFMVLLANLADAQEVAARLARNIANKIHAAILTPFALPTGDCALGASIGVTLFPKDLERDDDVLKEADTAMHRAKAAGRNNVYFFEAAMQAEVENRFALESELRRAIGRDELRLYLQPQVDRNGRIVAAEVLLRWQHPERGLVPPFHFIPLAEETGLIVPMGEWVLEKTCRCLARMAEAGQALRLAVNVSPRQLRQPHFAQRIKALLVATGADPGQLTLEMTEGLAIENIDSAITTLSELKALGLHLSIDDFGTGYSSLTYLKRLPINELKIDQSFIRDVPGDPNDVALVEAILAVARHLSLSVVAEGVETEEQVAFLRARGCDLYQGYLFGRPEPAETFLLSL